METNFAANPTAIKAGLMIDRNGEACITPAGIFAIAGMMACDRSADKETSLHCAMGFHRVLRVAKESGLAEQTAQVILAAFAHRVSPTDGSDEGNALAALCRQVANTVGVDRVADLIEGKPTH
jgi:hypothetical protein